MTRRPPYLTRWRWWMHRLGRCPKYVLGYECRGGPGECGWRAVSHAH